MTQTADDFLTQGGVAGHKFDTIGSMCEGVVEEKTLMQQRDINSNEPKVWKNGDPMMQVRIILRTATRDPEIEEDDGRRAIYVRGQMRNAVRDAIKAGGADKLEVGGTLAVKYQKDGEKSDPRLSAPKQYVARYTPPVKQAANVAAADDWADEPF